MSTQDPTPRRHSIIHLQGGTNTYVHLPPVQVEELVTAARDADSPARVRRLLYIPDPHVAKDTVVIDPHQVTAIFGVIAPQDQPNRNKAGLTSLTYSQAKQ